MTREKLEAIKGDRRRFKGTFKEYSLKSAYRGLPNQTLLLVDVKTLEGEKITDHLWFNLTKGFDALGDLHPGDIIAFDARVRPYMKGYVGRGVDNREVDYKLNRPTKIELLWRAPRTEGDVSGYYTICTRCGHRNRTSMIRDHNQGRRFPARCRRCGHRLEGWGPPPIKPPEIPKVKQMTLGG